MTDTELLLALLVLAGGAGIFLRIVAKEKLRREKWLLFRQEMKVKELKEKRQKAEEEESKVIVVH